MPEPEDRSSRAGGIQVISRAFAVLRALDGTGASLGALARATGLPRSTVQRIVDSLAAENMVEIGDGGVRPGWGLQQLANAGQSLVALRVRPQLQALFDATHETVDISTFHGRQVTFLDRIISDRELRVVPFNDRPRPLYAMANGKAILSCLEDARIASLFPEPLPALTPHTLTTLDALRADLDAIRGEGLSYDRQEHALGVCAIGAPIRAPGLPPHAISAVLPAVRFAESLPRLKAALLACRAAMEEALRAG